MKRLLTLLVLVLVGTTAAAEKRVVLLGVRENMEFMQQWASIEEARLTSGSKAQAIQSKKSSAYILAPKSAVSLPVRANTLHEADVAIIVVDATIGTLPHNREDALLVRQTRVPTIAIMLANVQDLFAAAPSDARELLRLVEAEMREVLRLYEVGGDQTLLFHDANRDTWAPATADAGLKDIGSVLGSLPLRRSPPAGPRLQTSAPAQVYFLTDGEAPGYAVSFNDTTSLDMWSEGSATTVAVTSAQPVGPGDVVEVTLQSAKEFAGDPGSRFMLSAGDRIVGIGVITK